MDNFWHDLAVAIVGVVFGLVCGVIVTMFRDVLVRKSLDEAAIGGLNDYD